MHWATLPCGPEALLALAWSGHTVGLYVWGDQSGRGSGAGAGSWSCPETRTPTAAAETSPGAQDIARGWERRGSSSKERCHTEGLPKSARGLAFPSPYSCIASRHQAGCTLYPSGLSFHTTDPPPGSPPGFVLNGGQTDFLDFLSTD